MILCRYSNVDFVFNLPVEEGIALINKALEKQSEDQAFVLYASRYPYMNEKTFIPFEQFYKPQKTVEIKQKSSDEILEEVKNILNSNVWG